MTDQLDPLSKVAVDIFDLGTSGNWNTDQIRALITGYVAAIKPKYHTPGPQEIALQLGAALAASGLYDTPGAALAAAWMAVPEYYMGRDAYLTELAPMIYAQQSPPEGSADERAAET